MRHTYILGGQGRHVYSRVGQVDAFATAQHTPVRCPRHHIVLANLTHDELEHAIVNEDDTAQGHVVSIREVCATLAKQ